MQGIVRISEAANLAIHAMAYLAGLPEHGPATATQIASTLGVSESHLGKVLQRLTHAGLLASVRGARGGFALRGDPGEVHLLELLEAIDGPLAASGCLLGTPVCKPGRCRLTGVLGTVNEIVRRELGSITLSAFASEAAAPPAAGLAARPSGGE